MILLLGIVKRCLGRLAPSPGTTSSGPVTMGSLTECDAVVAVSASDSSESDSSFLRLLLLYGNNARVSISPSLANRPHVRGPPPQRRTGLLTQSLIVSSLVLAARMACCS